MQWPLWGFSPLICQSLASMVDLKPLVRVRIRAVIRVNITRLALELNPLQSGAVEEAGSRAKWTETPADRERKRLAKLAGVDVEGHGASSTGPEAEPDVVPTTVYSRGAGSRASKSLLEAHTDAQKKAKPAEPTGYQPFDRERDLQVPPDSLPYE